MVHVTHPSELSAVAERLRGLVAGISPEWVTPREAPGLWSGLEDIRRLASGAQVVLAGLVDESDAPAKAGLRNGAEWMAQRSGGSLRSGYDAVATAKRLTDLPDVTAALRDGRLSVVQATAIADAAAVDPTAAGRLVELAQKVSLCELRRECLRVKAVADPDPDRTRERIRRERRVRWFVDNEGAFNLSGRGPIEAGSEVATVLAPIIEDIFAAAREAGVPEPRDAYTWDALVEMARMAWAYMHNQTAADIHGDDHDHSAGRSAQDGAPGRPLDLVPDTETTDGGRHAGGAGSPGGPAPEGRSTSHAGGVADPRVADGGRHDDGADNGDDSIDVTTADGARGDHRDAGTSQGDTSDDDPGADADCATANDQPSRTDGADRTDNVDGVDKRAEDATGDEPAGPVGQPMRRRRANGVNPWLRVAIRVDYSALVRGWVDGEETCDIAGVGPIPVRVARELLGDAVLHLLVTKGRDVATVAYLGRGQNTAQRIASAWAQPECQRLGCHRPVMEWDHRRPFAQNRVTEIANIDGLCKPDHWLKTVHGWELVDGVGKRPMVPPADPRHPANARSKTRDGPPDPTPAPAPEPALEPTGLPASTGPQGSPESPESAGSPEPPGSPELAGLPESAGSPEIDELSLFDETQPGLADAASRSLLLPVGA